MIQEFIERFQEIKPHLLEQFSEEQPTSYNNILVQTLGMMFEDEGYGTPDWENITIVDDGDYQGTLVFIIPEKGYQPDTYWAIKVAYGSCSGCDTYEAYAEWDEKDYHRSAPHMVTMALHMIESMREI